MKISVRNIPADGLSLAKTVNASEIGLTEDIINSCSPLEISGVVEKASQAVIANVSVKGRYRFVCSRCLEEFEKERYDQFNMIFELTPTTEFIELGEDIRQEMIVAFSFFNSLCSDSCKGLCKKCGYNLNKGQCSCST